MVKLTPTQKKFRKDMALHHGQKNKRGFHLGMFLVIVAIVMIALSTGRFSNNSYTILKHERIVEYMNEAYGAYLDVHNSMNDILGKSNGYTEENFAREIRAFHRELSYARTVFRELKVPKHFEQLHSEMEESIFVLEKMNLELAGLAASNDYDNLNAIINERKLKVDSVTRLLESAFERANMQFRLMEDGSFMFWYVSDKENKHVLFSKN